MGDESIVEIQTVGTITTISVVQGRTVELATDNVALVKELNIYLLSVCFICKKNLEVTFKLHSTTRMKA